MEPRAARWDEQLRRARRTLLERPAAEPVLRITHPDLVVKGLRRLRHADLAQDQASIVSYDTDFTVAASAEEVDDVAEDARARIHGAASYAAV